jgi:hypothetical protein
MDRIEDMSLARPIGSSDIGFLSEIYRENIDTTPGCEGKRREQGEGGIR